MTPPTAQVHEYLLALLNSGQGKLFPVCLVLDGPMGYSPSASSSSQPQQSNFSSKSNHQQPDTLVAIKLSKDVPIHREVLKEIFSSQNLSILTMVGLSGICIMSSFCGRNTFRTMCRNTSLVLSSYLRIIAQQNASKQSATVNGQHNIDVDGNLKMVLDHEVVHLYLVSGTLYLDGSVAATTTDSDHIEHLYNLERQTQMCYSLSPAVLTRNQLANSFDCTQQQQQQPNDGGGGAGGQSQLSQSQAKMVRDSLAQRFPNCGIQCGPNEQAPPVGQNQPGQEQQQPGQEMGTGNPQQKQPPPPQQPREQVPLAENSPLVHSILGPDRQDTDIYCNTTIDLPTLPVANNESALELSTKIRDQGADCSGVTPREILIAAEEYEKSLSASWSASPNIMSETTIADRTVSSFVPNLNPPDTPEPQSSNLNQEPNPNPPSQDNAAATANNTTTVNVEAGASAGADPPAPDSNQSPSPSPAGGIALNVETNTTTTTGPTPAQNGENPDSDSSSQPPGHPNLVGTKVDHQSNTTQVQGVLETENSSGAKQKLNVKIKTIHTTTEIIKTFTKSIPNIPRAVPRDGAEADTKDNNNTTTTTNTTNVTLATGGNEPAIGSGNQQSEPEAREGEQENLL